MPDRPLRLRRSDSVRCTCTVPAPRREFARGRSFGWAVYVDEIHDGTRFDPNCPYHGEDGSMVVTLSVGGGS